MTPFIMYSLFDGVTSFLQLMGVKTYVKTYLKDVFQTKKRFPSISNSLFKIAESILNLKKSFIFLTFLCVGFEIYSCWQ